MMLFSLLIGALVDTAHADTLSNAGGGPGVASMWSTICSTLPCSTSAGSGGSGLIVALSGAVINFVFPLVSVVAVCMVIYAGIQIIMSNGAEDKVSEAKKIILYAAVGVVLSLMTTAIITFATSFLKGIFS